jgi:hypothetical protein
MAAIGLVIGRAIIGWPVTYQDIGVLLAIGGALLQIDFGAYLLRRFTQDNSPPPSPDYPPYQPPEQEEKQTEEVNDIFLKKEDGRLVRVDDLEDAIAVEDNDSIDRGGE